MARGPGNVLMIEIESEHVTEVFTAVGRKGVPAEAVADSVSAEARAYLDSGVPVGEYLADQLVVPLALAGKGCFATLEPSPHTRTNMEVIRQFLGTTFAVDPGAGGLWTLRLGG
jgi:RNA 3'-terminal phosphate cyclase (ATP)